jgi:DNA-binding XRE family transcriptional regulator
MALSLTKHPGNFQRPARSDFGARLRHLRVDELGITRMQAAARTGISEWTFGEWESKGVQPLLSTLIQLSKGLGVKLCYWQDEGACPTLQNTTPPL